MNVREGLEIVRQRLVDNDAQPATLDCVDLFIRRAGVPAVASASAGSLVQLVRMLMRTPAANNDVRVYNDLVRLEEEMDLASAAARERRAVDEAKPIPKTKKYYKELKEREKKTARPVS